MTDDMPQRYRRRMHSIHNSIFRRGNHERGQRCSIIGYLGCDAAFQGIAGVGLGIDHRHVDTLFVKSRSPGKIAGDAISFKCNCNF